MITGDEDTELYGWDEDIKIVMRIIMTVTEVVIKIDNGIVIEEVMAIKKQVQIAGM